MCPLSNFHPSPFWCDGNDFRWVEEYLFHRKAEFADDQVAVSKILNASSPAECKQIGRTIKVDRQKWNNEEIIVMRKALQEKFDQNSDLKDYLLNTGDLTLGEASPTDRFWGIGCGLGREDTTKRIKWTGKNKLGELLMTLRSQMN